MSVDREGAVWVTEPKGAIKKANLTFTVKFLWLIVHHCLSPITVDNCLSPITVDNIVTWDRAVLMVAMIVGFEMDFAWLLQAVMHERDFKVTTTYPFPCMIFLMQTHWCSHLALINSRLRWALLISASLGMRPMSWLHAEGPVHSCLHLVQSG